MGRLTNFVGGESLALQSGTYVEFVSPVTGQTMAEMPVSSGDDVNHAVRVATATFQSWKS